MTLDKETLLFALAVYAAALSTWNFLDSLRKERRAVRVVLGTKVPATGEYGRTPFAHLKVTNIGYRPVTITTIGLHIPGGKWLNPGVRRRVDGMNDTPLPTTLSDGQTAEIFYPLHDIAEALFATHGPGIYHVVPFAHVSAGGTHHGKGWEVDTSEYIR